MTGGWPLLILTAALLSVRADEDSAKNETLSLPTFTYAATDADIKEAAFKAGQAVKEAPENAFRPPTDGEGAGMKEAAGAAGTWRPWASFLVQQRRRQREAALRRRVAAARRVHAQLMLRVCYQRCNAYINESFPRPDLSAASNASARLEAMEMGAFPARYLSMGLAEMRNVTHANCEQWEADYQCIFGCTGSAPLVQRLKTGLEGDFHLTANVECPNPAFAELLPCVGEKLEAWLGPCEAQLNAYQSLKAGVSRRIQAIQRQAEQLSRKIEVEKSRGRPFLGTLGAYILPYALRMQREQSKLCAAYGSLLMCSLPALRAECSERAASFVHTSLSHTFPTQILPGKELVLAQLGRLSATCSQIGNKAIFRLFPIRK